MATTEIDANLSKWLYPLLGYRPYNAEVGLRALFSDDFLEIK